MMRRRTLRAALWRAAGLVLLSCMVIAPMWGCVDEETARLRECEEMYARSYLLTLSPGAGPPSLCFEEETMTDFTVPPPIPPGCSIDVRFAETCAEVVVDVTCPDGPDQELDVERDDDGGIRGTFARIGERGEGRCTHRVEGVPGE